MSRATYNRKGERPERYNVAHVTFDENRNEKLYAYWIPPGWDVQPGDKLQVMVSEREARKWTTVRNVGGLVPMGTEHKTALGHTPMPRERKEMDLSKLEGRMVTGIEIDDESIFLNMKFAEPSVIRTGIQQLEFYRSQVAEAMCVPPELLGSSRTVTGRIPLPSTPQPDNIPKEHAMISLETPTFLNGKDIRNYSDAELFEIIRRDEAEIKNLMGIEAKPKALKDRINELQAGIDKLVAFMDSRG